MSSSRRSSPGRHASWRGVLGGVAMLLAGCAAAMAQDMPKAATAGQAPAVSSKAQAVTVLQAADVAPGLFELIEDNGRLYVTSAGEDRRNGMAGHVLVLDAATLEVVQSVESPEKPFAVAANHRTGKLYIGHSMDRKVSVYDLGNMQRVAVVALEGQDENGKPFRSRQLLVDEASDKVYVSSPSERGPVWIIDGATSKLIGQVPEAGGPGIALDARRQQLYTSGRGFFSVIDLATGRVVARHTVADVPDRFLVNLEADPQRGRLLATESQQGEVLALSPDTGAILARASTGAGALALRLDRDADTLYVSNRNAGTLTVLDPATLSVRQQLALPPYPQSLAFGPGGGVLYLSIKQPRDAAAPGYREDRLERIVKLALPS